MELYEIYWYPKVYGDAEKESTFVLCNSMNEARQIAKTYFKNVQVVEIQKYADIAGGDKGEEYWARYVMLKGKVYTYYEYKKLIANED